MLVQGYSYSQNEFNLREIKFSSKHSMMIPNNFVEITLNNYPRNKGVYVNVVSKPMYDTDKWAHTKIDTAFVIPAIEFVEIEQEIAKLKLEDLHKNLRIMGVDGYSTTLTYGNSFNTVTFKVFGPSYNTEERHLSTYLSNCQLILKTACLEPNTIFLE